MKKKYMLLLLAAAILPCLLPGGGAFLARAQEKPGEGKVCSGLIFSVTTRFRYEFQNNFNQKYYGDELLRGNSNDGMLLGRFRAGLDWYPSKHMHLALWGQHSQSWDAALPDSAFYQSDIQATNHPNRDHWELYTTFVELTDLFDSGIGIKAGRQTISYGDIRVFGPGEWGNTGVWIWDAVKLSWSFDRGFIDAYYGRTMVHEVRRFSLNHRHGYESLGLYGHLDLLKKPVTLFIEPMVFTKDDRHKNYTGEKKAFYRQPDGTRVTYKKQDDLDSWYGGARMLASFRGFELGGTFLQEKGRFARDDLNAYGYHSMLAYSFRVPWKPRLAVEYSYASGDDNPNDANHETFQGAFGARCKMYGRMNLFHWRNLKDLEANLQIKPFKWLHVKGELHKFQLAERKDAWYLNQKLYRDSTGCSGDDVGKEFDIVITCNLFPQNTFTTGFGHFWPDEFAEKTASHKQANWFFFQWEYTFSTKLL